MLILVLALSVTLALTIGILVGFLIRRRQAPARFESHPSPAVERGNSASNSQPGPPVLRMHPEDQEVLAGEPATFVAEALGNGLSYQWQRNGIDIPGANQPRYKSAELGLEASGDTYQVVVRNAAGMVESQAAKVVVKCERIIAGDPARPVLEVRRLLRSVPLGAPLDVNDALSRNLQPLLQQAPGLLQSSIMATGDYYVVKYSAELLKGLTDGTYRQVMTSGGGILSNVAGKNGFVGHGEFIKIGGVNVMGAILGVWQLMAIVTAQKFLSDINKRLANLERGVREIREWLEHKERAKLEASHGYVMQVVARLAAGDLSEVEGNTYLNQIEMIERDAVAQYGLYVQVMLDRYNDLKIQDVSGVGLEENAEALSRIGQDYARASVGALTALLVRGSAAHVRLALPVIPEVSCKRVAELRELKEFHDRRQELFDEMFDQRVLTLKGRFSFSTTDQNKRDTVRAQVDKHIDLGCRLMGDLSDGIEAFQQAVQASERLYKEGCALAVRVNPSGEILSVNEVQVA